MRLTIPTLRIAGALGLAAGLMIGCQDFLGADKTTDPTSTPDDQSGALSLSIRNDSACLGEWHAILDARSAGHPDSAAEAAFLATCVTEVKPEKGTPKPTVPPVLLPDSGMRCKWIVSQIEGGRDSLTVSYRKYCPDDCRKLESEDSASHDKLCHEPKPRPDTLPPPRPNPGEDTCKMLHDKLEVVKPGQPGRADLEHQYAAMCKTPVPPDTNVMPPWHPDDTCAMLRAQLAVVKPGEPGRAELEHLYAARCQDSVPHDTVPVPPKPLPGPEADTCRMILERLAHLDSAGEEFARWKTLFAQRCGGILPPPPPTDTGAPQPPPKPTLYDSVCMELKLRLSATAPGSAGRSELEAAFKAECSELLPPPPTTTVNCDALRLKMSMLDTASADYARLAVTLKEHCPVVPAR